jgi:plastocyanin
MTATGTWRGWKFAAAIALVAFGLALMGLRGAIASAGDTTAHASRGGGGVEINHFAFHPPTLTIAKGTKVTFSNTSHVTHTATRAGSFSTGRIKPGTSASIRFNQPGTYAYHCSIHPFMHGKIVVQ